MTVSTLTNRVEYIGNGSTTQFAVPFKVLDEDHLVVKRRLISSNEIDYNYIGTDYSYSGIGADSGTLTLDGAALSSAYQLEIERIVPYTQPLDIVNSGGFYPETVEEQLDLMVMGIQQIDAQSDDIATRALMVPVGDTAPTYAEFAAAFQGAQGPAGSVAVGSLPLIVAPVVGDGVTDDAPVINATLSAAPAGSTVMLSAGSGVVALNSQIVIPSYITLDLAGRTLKPKATFVQTGFPTSTLVRSAETAVRPVLRGNGVIDVNKHNLASGNPINAVMMWKAQDFLVEDIEAKNVTNYSFWAMSAFGDAIKPSGTFRRLRSFNAEVHFETTRGENVLWNGMVYGDGAGDIPTEAVWHALGGCKNVTYINGVGRGRGKPVSLAANEAEPMVGVTLVNLRGTTTENMTAVEIASTHASFPAVSADIFGCHFESEVSVGATITGPDTVVTWNGGSLRGFSQGFSIVSGRMSVSDLKLVVDVTNPATVTAYAVSASAGVLFQYNDGSMELNANSVVLVDGTGEVYISNDTLIEPMPANLSPGGIRQTVTRELHANYVHAGGVTSASIGVGTDDEFAFAVALGRVYRVRVKGSFQVSSGLAQVGIASYMASGTAGTVTGIMTLQSALDTAPAVVTARSLVESATGAIIYHLTPTTGVALDFEMDVVVRSNGAGTFKVLCAGTGANTLTIISGAKMDVERIQ